MTTSGGDNRFKTSAAGRPILDRRTTDALRSVADGRFQSQLEDLRSARLKRLARIDQDHMSRGLYSTSSRLALRQEANREHLRAVLEARITSTSHALQEAGHEFSEDLIAFASDQVGSICEAAHADMGKENEIEARKCGSSQLLLESLIPAVDRDVKLEQTRAQRLLATEVGMRQLQPKDRSAANTARAPQPTTTVDRGPLLRGWDAILTVAEKHSVLGSGGRSTRDALRRMNKSSNGPIQNRRKRPEVYQQALIVWLQSLGGATEEDPARVEAARRELAERGGARLADLKFHTEKRPNARGKARPPPDKTDSDRS